MTNDRSKAKAFFFFLVDVIAIGTKKAKALDDVE